VTTNGNGVATMVIGEGTPTKGTFSAIDWANGSYFLQTSIDLGGGASALSSISPLLSVPYALYAEKANVDLSGYYSKTEIDAMLAELESKIGNGGGGGSSQQGNVADGNGAIKAAFSVSDSKQVYFSQGNLQYQASTGTWRFAEHQYDIIGNDNANISSTNSGWIDLFGWGTSGWNSGANAYQPYSTSTTYKDYYPGGSYSNNLTGTYANADWGVYNAISNGGNQAGQWRTLSADEWYYLFNGRPHADRLYSQGRVDGLSGLIVLPDNWTTPSSIQFSYQVTNSYSVEEWNIMQSCGAVFLPDAGRRLDNSGVFAVGTGGYYWSSSYSDDETAYNVITYDDYVDVIGGIRATGFSVRLVKEVE